MCGIAGIFASNPNGSELQKLLDPIVHRGEKKYRYEVIINSEIALGTHRLAIEDEESGKQPFQSKDKLVTAILNGQIYNHQNLRSQLSSLHRFSSLNDTEVVLAAYLKWGKDFINHLDGKFAIALYDSKIKELILARDRMGVKPLYFSYNGEGWIFASEVKSLVSSTVTEINELPPGALWINGEVIYHFSLRKFNSLPKYIKKDEDINTVLKDSLVNAVTKRIKIEDNKVACLLSGGIDSSLITYIASQVHPNVVAYTIAAPGKSSLDLAHARLLTDLLGIQHIVVSPSVEEMGEFYLNHGVYMTESFEPVLVRNAVVYHFVCRQVVSDGFKYCLNGEGADELFGGYDFIKEVSPAMRDDIIWHSLSIIHNTYLKMADRASMYATLEARVPYMDKDFIEVALDLPPHCRLNESINKVVLRALYQNELPVEITHRKKVGMNEGAGFGINSSEHSIYYQAVKSYYDKAPFKFNEDMNLCVKEGEDNNIDLTNIEEIYNFARFIEYGFKKLIGGTERLQLNTSLKKTYLKMALST